MINQYDEELDIDEIIEEDEILETNPIQDIDKLKAKAIGGENLMEEFHAEEEDIMPKGISNRLIRDFFLFIGVSFLFFYMGIKTWEISFIGMGVILVAITVIMIVGTIKAYQKGNIAEKHGVIMGIERMPLRKSNAKLYIQTVESEHYMIRVNDKINPYQTGDELLFYFRSDKHMIKDGGTYILSEPLSIKIMSRAGDEDEIEKSKNILEKIKSNIYKK